MGVITVKIDDEVEKRFRKAVIDVYGSKRGVLGKAIEEAIKLWLSKYEKQK